MQHLLSAQAPIVAVALFWLLLVPATGDEPHIGLAFAPIMALSTALAPAMRLQLLFLRPALGLHELALLPGLPQHPAPSVASQLGRQMIARSLPALGVMAGFALLVGAPRHYHLLLLWTCAASLLLLSGTTLLSLHSRAARWACAVVMALVTVALLASMVLAMRDGFPSWLQAAWSAALVAGVLVQGAALLRLKHLPHPWLQA